MNIDMNGRDTERAITEILCGDRVSGEITAELSLPEHQPEIRKLLCVSEKILPPAKYVSASGVEYNGVVDYKVTYIGTDGALWSADFSEEYEQKVSAQIDDAADTDATVTIACDSTTVRVSSPRRISVRTRYNASVRAHARRDTEPQTYGECDEDGIEKLYAKIGCACVFEASSEIIEKREEISGIGEGCRVVSAAAAARVGEIRRGSEGLSATGDMNLQLLVAKEGGRVESVTRRIPFEGLVECDRPVSEAACKVTADVTDIAVNVEEGRALCDLTLVLHATVAREESCKYVNDAYSVERECECKRESVCIPTLIACASGSFSQNERIALADTAVPEGAQIVDVKASARLPECEGDGGRYTFAGACRYTVVWEKDGEYGSDTVERPVRYSLDGESCDSPEAFATAEPIECRARVDGELLCIDAEIGVGVEIYGRQTCEIVDEISCTEPLARQKNRMVVYYPAEGESEWEVAKKYHVPAESLTKEKNYYLF